MIRLAYNIKHLMMKAKQSKATFDDESKATTFDDDDCRSFSTWFWWWKQVTTTTFDADVFFDKLTISLMIYNE
jgi:hypothetical protein